MTPSRRNVLKALSALPLTCFAITASAAKEAPITIRINIPGPYSLPFLPIELIPLLGIDRAMGAQLIIRYFPSGVRGLEDMLAGNAHFSAQGFSVLPAFYGKGHRVQALAPLNGAVPPYGFVVREDLYGQIKSVASLKGRSIGASVGNITSKTYLQQVAEVFLANNGVNPSEVRWVATAQNWEGQFGALASKSVDAVFCEEPFLTALERKKAGFNLARFNDPKAMAKIPGAGHIRATLTTRADYLAQDPRTTELMVGMLRQSLEWMRKAGPEEIVRRLDLSDEGQKRELIEVLARNTGMYARDARFTREQIEATTAFMRTAGILRNNDFDITVLIPAPMRE